MELNHEVIKDALENWGTIICSVSSAQRNGKIKNRITWVKIDDAEKCINSFLDSIERKTGKKEKLTNYIVGQVNLTGVKVEEGKPNMIRATEYLDTGVVGVVKEFTANEEGVYELSKEYNIYLGTKAGDKQCQ